MISSQALVDKFRYAFDNNWGYIWGAAGVLWTEAKQNASTRKQTIDYGRKWIGHMVADCSGLFKWAFKQLGGDIYHGSNTMYKSYCTAKGKLVKGERSDSMALRPGTAVFTGTQDEHGHVGLYIGDGDVIEAASTQKGVIKSRATDKKWTYWGELKGVEYGEAPAPDPDYRPTLRKGDKGEYVTLMQTKLLQKGYDLGKWGADGAFGMATEEALKAFQRDHGLTVDGICGPKSWAALQDNTPASLFTVTVPHMTKFQAEALIKQYTGAFMTEERS